MMYRFWGWCCLLQTIEKFIMRGYWNNGDQHTCCPQSHYHDASMDTCCTVLLRPDLHAMLHVMRIFTGADLHKPASRVMVKSGLHFVSVRRCVLLVTHQINIRFDQFSAWKLQKQTIQTISKWHHIKILRSQNWRISLQILQYTAVQIFWFWLQKRLFIDTKSTIFTVLCYALWSSPILTLRASVTRYVNIRS